MRADRELSQRLRRGQEHEASTALGFLGHILVSVAALLQAGETRDRWGGRLQWGRENGGFEGLEDTRGDVCVQVKS